MLQQAEITNEYAVLALYGTNGLTGEHTKALEGLRQLEEIIFFLNGDAPGKEAVKKHASLLGDLLPEIKLTNAEPPDSEDVNSLLQGHEPGVLSHYLRERQPVIFSNENLPVEKESPPAAEEKGPGQARALDTKKPHHILYRGQAASYIIKGLVKGQLDSLKVTLFIEHAKTKRKSRGKLNL